MIDPATEQAARIVGAYATLREIVLPAMEGEARHDPKTVRHLEQAATALEKAMDRMFCSDRLAYETHRVLEQRALVIDAGQMGVVDAYDRAKRAFLESKPTHGGSPSVRAFLTALRLHLGVQKVSGDEVLGGREVQPDRDVAPATEGRAGEAPPGRSARS